LRHHGQLTAKDLRRHALQGERKITNPDLNEPQIRVQIDMLTAQIHPSTTITFTALIETNLIEGHHPCNKTAQLFVTHEVLSPYYPHLSMWSLWGVKLVGEAHIHPKTQRLGAVINSDLKRPES
jgi:hypothetical protein